MNNRADANINIANILAGIVSEGDGNFSRIATGVPADIDSSLEYSLFSNQASKLRKLCETADSFPIFRQKGKTPGWGIRRILSMVLVINFIGLFVTNRVLAIPPLPSSFYGTVKVNRQNVPDGTLVRSLVNGQVYAEALTQTYQGESVYALDVPGEDTVTVQRDGGLENDTVQFEIGGVLAQQYGTWRSGSNVNLDLTATATSPFVKPLSTSRPIPSQTAIIVIPKQPAPTVFKPSSTVPATVAEPKPTVTLLMLTTQIPASINLTSLTAAPLTQRPLGTGESEQPASSASLQMHSYATSISSINIEENNSQSSSSILFIGVITLLFVGMIFLIVYCVIRTSRNISDES